VTDAEHAVKNGADLIGMIMWPKAKRSVDDATAAAISACASTRFQPTRVLTLHTRPSASLLACPSYYFYANALLCLLLDDYCRTFERILTPVRVK
jgi:hypothetical protein